MSGITPPSFSSTRFILRRAARRLAILLIAGGLFFGIASVVNPSGPRSAEALPSTLAFPSAPALAPQPEPTHTAPAHPKGYKLLGTLEGHDHTVHCWATPSGPRYSVHAPDGKLLQDDLPADEVYRAFPDVDLENMRDLPSTPTPVMLVDPKSE